MEILNYEGLLKYNEALHEDLLTNYASVLDINAVELDIEALKTNKVDMSDMMTPDSANGHAYVDLGLPSGTLWATMNVGASSETDFGNYYKYGKGAEQYDNTQADYRGTEDPLDSSADTASVVWGGSWHMPTQAQLNELTANTTYEWTTINGVNGGKFTAQNGNYVFLPAAGRWRYGSTSNASFNGYYWGSSPDGSVNAYYLYFGNGNKVVDYSLRLHGFSVRGVIDGPIATPGPKYATKEELNTVAGTKQDVIDSSHKLSADLITDGTTNKVINVKPDWNAASDSDAEILNKPTNVSSFTNDAKYVTEDDMQVTTMDANGHDYVDLGLPSGTKWATMNVGASSETDYGNYYQYGKGAAQYAETSGDSNYSGTENPLDSSVDTATQEWGGGWHMPIEAQLQELVDNTTYQWVTDYQGSGVNGATFTANGQTLFIPAAGHYNDGSLYFVGEYGYLCSSTPDVSEVQNEVYFLHFGDGYENVYHGYRSIGFPVRGVINASKGPKYATKAELAGVATSGSYNDLNDKPTIPTVQIITNQEIALLFDPYRGHEYVEIAGIKWATMNVGASQPSDYGLYFQWGDISGYTVDQVGNGEGKKYFGWADYKYGNGTSSPGTTSMTKYNASDRKTVLEASDDAATAYLGGDWRMPTREEFVALGNSVTTAWTTNYNNSGVAGMICTDKTDSSKVLFFPAAGYCYNGSVLYAGSNGGCWSSSLYSSNVVDAYYLFFNSSRVNWQDYHYRHYGRPVRLVAD